MSAARPDSSPANLLQSAPLYVDDRERSDPLWAAMRDLGLPITRCRLPAGDFLITGRWRVERKTVSDFRASLFDGRLFRQMAHLRRFPEAPLLLLEGDLGASPPLPGELGALLTLILEADFPVVPSPSPQATARLLALLHDRPRRARSPSPRNQPDRHRSPAAHLLAALPGIGHHKAAALLHHFGHLAAVGSASPEDLATVPGIGPALARRLQRAFQQPHAAPVATANSRISPRLPVR